jgi:alpha-ketoglutarate-dependent taurine dioxygenase
MPKSPSSLLSLTDFNGRPLPAELERSSFASLMRDNGYVYMCNVPPEFDPVGFCHRLGPFIPQYTGVLVGDVVPEPGMDDVYHSGNTRALLPHTEGYDFEGLPPRYMALWCVVPVHGAGGETTLADGYQWIRELHDTQLSLMRQHVHRWKTTDGALRMGLRLSTEHPILEDHPQGLILRFSCNNLLHQGDSRILEILESGRSFFDRTHVAVDHEVNGMLVWDNWRMLHSRNAFTDRSRHLKRVQIGSVAAERTEAADPARPEALAHASP